ncbi:MAG: IS630 family transposase [Armatimonadetes bacterium]|nr:IS630 family transposase [Armatimonadota bacterium]
MQKNRVARKLDGTQEAHLVALTCSAPPQGFARWTLRLLRERLIEMEVADSIAPETIRQTLKKPTQTLAEADVVLATWARCPLCGSNGGCFGGLCPTLQSNASVVCLDEGAKQLLGEVREPLPCEPGQPLRFDSEYQRHGTCALFLLFEPLAVQRFVQIKARRTALDYAHTVKWMCDHLYPHVEKIVLVQDNLNTYGAHSLYQAFAPPEARHLCERIKWHFTPNHASWLNMAELELSVLARQCLQERMESQQNLARQVQAWQDRRNHTASRVNWHFTTQDARNKLKRLYPQLLRG